MPSVVLAAKLVGLFCLLEATSTPALRQGTRERHKDGKWGAGSRAMYSDVVGAIAAPRLSHAPEVGLFGLACREPPMLASNRALEPPCNTLRGQSGQDKNESGRRCEQTRKAARTLAARRFVGAGFTHDWVAALCAPKRRISVRASRWTSLISCSALTRRALSSSNLPLNSAACSQQSAS